MKIGSREIAWLENPYLTPCVPPALLVLQFLLLVALFSHGLPESMTQAHAPAAMMIAALFALVLPAFPAMLLGVRHLIYGSNKVAPAFGVALNGLYLLGFLVFFIFFFVVKTTA